MITATVIFGEDAVNRYEETNKVPSTRWLNKNGGVVDEIEFKTKAEFDAYSKALNDADSWHGSMILPPIEIQEDCPHCNKWRSFFSGKDTPTYCPDCGQKILN
ncbi:MAG: hypothetical protein LUD40_07940 [Phocaeicola dorei]|nr:hypothetical protein [Phocaeicola dorei]